MKFYIASCSAQHTDGIVTETRSTPAWGLALNKQEAMGKFLEWAKTVGPFRTKDKERWHNHDVAVLEIEPKHLIEALINMDFGPMILEAARTVLENPI